MTETRCSGCYVGFSGPWCDNCDQWPCICVINNEEESGMKKHYDIDCNITTSSDFVVELVQSVGDDEMICKAARVSTLGAESLDTKESAGMINFLMKNRHGSPFEHNTMTFRVTEIIATSREFKRHRIGFSFNEQSARYMELEDLFYVPDRDRPLVQVGKPGAYTYEPGTDEQYALMERQLHNAYSMAWESYQTMLHAGIAKEVARFALPVGMYSTSYVTCNARSMMAFLSLRTKHDGATFPSYPMHEIETVALAMESRFMELFPLTWQAFCEHGRVSP